MAKKIPRNDSMTLGDILRKFSEDKIPLDVGVVAVNPTHPCRWRFEEVVTGEKYSPEPGEIHERAQYLRDEGEKQIPNTLYDNILVVVSQQSGGRFTFTFEKQMFWTRNRVMAGVVVGVTCAFLGFFVLGPIFYRSL